MATKLKPNVAMANILALAMCDKRKQSVALYLLSC
jgi:hypothetical protein